MKNSKALLVFFSIFNMANCHAAPISVGTSYGGGTVFCVSQTPDISKCVPEGSGNYGLIMANEDQVNFDSNEKHGVSWAAADYRTTGAVSDDDGRANTATIIAVHPHDNPGNNAAWACHNYRDKTEGHDDWYLPSKNELNKMYIYARTHNLIGRNCAGSKPGGIQCFIGGYVEDCLGYWSSTEYSGYCTEAWRQYFIEGRQYYDDKARHWFGARAVRAFINLSIQPFNNLPQPRIRQIVERFIHDAEETGEIDITKLQAVPDAESILTILNWLKTTRTIKTLNLTNIDLREFIEPLSELLAVRTDFTTINFTNCNLDVASIKRLLQNYRGLTHLSLGWNNVRDDEEDAVMLTEILQHNPALTVLDLKANRIGKRVVTALAKILANNATLTTLNLENNLIGSDGVEVLAEALQNNVRLTALYLGWNDVGSVVYDIDAGVLFETSQHNPSLIIYDLHRNSINPDDEAELNEVYSKKILLKLLRKIKCASSFTFVMGVRHNLTQYALPHILEYAGINVHNRTAFADVRDYDTEENRRIIFSGNLEEVIRLFYYGNHADYGEIIREINQLRRQQREFLQRNGHEIPAGQLLELPEGLPGVDGFTLTPARIAAAFWLTT